MKTIFLDANILFSTALGGVTFALLWELAAAGRIVLLTSRYCEAEARDNLRRKAPHRLDSLRELIELVDVASPLDLDLTSFAQLLPAKDAPVLAAAVAMDADVLLTGDLTHFGPLMSDSNRRPRVQTVRDFLLNPR